jgi:hypothetical protein
MKGTILPATPEPMAIQSYFSGDAILSERVLMKQFEDF